ncbi:hypothetical protein BURPS1710b_A1730 [Burkholderia pseudomallei 1710b]|uniref:Uncharacterized protein n=1 Tax=Burkholderia pseudomallei (strain 1710b) TaxID=320372 RepID=Q3JHR7_BURP1|nr:hypothetical protein BURPS1710b_A1730 [Burkholderia pseudomallei 1710b]
MPRGRGRSARGRHARRARIVGLRDHARRGAICGERAQHVRRHVARVAIGRPHEPRVAGPDRRGDARRLRGPRRVARAESRAVRRPARRRAGESRRRRHARQLAHGDDAQHMGADGRVLRHARDARRVRGRRYVRARARDRRGKLLDRSGHQLLPSPHPRLDAARRFGRGGAALPEFERGQHVGRKQQRHDVHRAALRHGRADRARHGAVRRLFRERDPVERRRLLRLHVMDLQLRRPDRRAAAHRDRIAGVRGERRRGRTTHARRAARYRLGQHRRDAARPEARRPAVHHAGRSARIGQRCRRLPARARRDVDGQTLERSAGRAGRRALCARPARPAGLTARRGSREVPAARRSRDAEPVDDHRQPLRGPRVPAVRRLVSKEPVERAADRRRRRRAARPRARAVRDRADRERRARRHAHPRVTACERVGAAGLADDLSAIGRHAVVRARRHRAIAARGIPPVRGPPRACAAARRPAETGRRRRGGLPARLARDEVQPCLAAEVLIAPHRLAARSAERRAQLQADVGELPLLGREIGIHDEYPELVRGAHAHRITVEHAIETRIAEVIERADRQRIRDPRRIERDRERVRRTPRQAREPRRTFAIARPREVVRREQREAARPQHARELLEDRHPAVVIDRVDAVVAEHDEREALVGERRHVARVHPVHARARMIAPADLDELGRVVDRRVVGADRLQQRHRAPAADADVENRLVAHALGDPCDRRGLARIGPAGGAPISAKRAAAAPDGLIDAVLHETCVHDSPSSPTAPANRRTSLNWLRVSPSARTRLCSSAYIRQDFERLFEAVRAHRFAHRQRRAARDAPRTANEVRTGRPISARARSGRSPRSARAECPARRMRAPRRARSRATRAATPSRVPTRCAPASRRRSAPERSRPGCPRDDAHRAATARLP